MEAEAEVDELAEDADEDVDAASEAEPEPEQAELAEEPTGEIEEDAAEEPGEAPPRKGSYFSFAKKADAKDEAVSDDEEPDPTKGSPP